MCLALIQLGLVKKLTAFGIRDELVVFYIVYVGHCEVSPFYYFILEEQQVGFPYPSIFWRLFSFSRHDILKNKEQNKTLNEDSTIVLPNHMLIVMEGCREARYID